MATPRLTPAQIAQVSSLVAQYIATQRERYASRAVPLSSQQRAAMDGFFSSQLLDGTQRPPTIGTRTPRVKCEWSLNATMRVRCHNVVHGFGASWGPLALGDPRRG